MDTAYTYGKSVVGFWNRDTDSQLWLSIVSLRLARLIYRKGKNWRNPVAFYQPPIRVDGYLLIGFAPSINRHIAIKEDRYGHR